MQIVIVGVAVLAILGTVGGNTATDRNDTAAPQAAVEQVRTKSAPKKCPHARQAIRYYRDRYTAHRSVRGVATPYPAGRKPNGCADAHYLAELWPERAEQARLATKAWLLEKRTLREQPTWIRAIREAQKAYPGTEWWLRSCSASEGAGRSLSINYFQMNHEGSGAGGWMQFMSSTFWRMWSTAEADVRARGFILKGKLASWSSRTGQALAAAWGLENGRRGEWMGSGC